MSFHLDDLVDLMKSEEKPSSSRNTAKKASVLFFSFGVKACSDQKIGINDIMVLENGFYSSGFFWYGPGWANFYLKKSAQSRLDQNAFKK